MIQPKFTEMPKADLSGSASAYPGLGDVPEDTATRAYKRVRCVHFTQIALLAIAFFACCTMVYCISQVRRTSESFFGNF
jgi:hypothetical protein